MPARRHHARRRHGVPDRRARRRRVLRRPRKSLRRRITSAAGCSTSTRGCSRWARRARSAGTTRPSIVPARLVPSYAGASTYLLLTKYNNYAGRGRRRREPARHARSERRQTDPISGIAAMREILTIAGPTPDADFPEHPERRPRVVHQHRRRRPGHELRARQQRGRHPLSLGPRDRHAHAKASCSRPGLGQAYTPTLIGPDGTVYAINNATLFAVGE